jgi:hypothetical protein
VVRFVTISKGSVGYANSKCLNAAIELNIPDILQKGPKSLSDLAVAANARPDRLQQVLRALQNNAIFSYDPISKEYSNNRTSELLTSDNPAGWRSWVELYGNEFYDMARGIPAACKLNTSRSPAQINYDTDDDMFTYFTSRGWVPKLHKTLGAGAIAQAPGILADYPWEQIADGELLDVGGGSGALIASLLREHKSMRGAIIDVPSVIDVAKKNFHATDGVFKDVRNRIPEDRLFSGNFFEKIPSFDYYVMKWCLHDWDDSRAQKILGNIRSAIKRGSKSRLIVLESVLTEGRAGRLSRYADLNMWMTINGQERTEAQWNELAKNTGWKLTKIYPLRNAWPCAIELVPDYTFVLKKDKENEILPAAKNVNTELEDARLLSNGTSGNGTVKFEGTSYPTTMSFIEPWDSAKGEPFFRSACESGFQSINFRWQDHNVIVTDARPNKDQFTLDTHAFAYFSDPHGLSSSLIEALRTGEKSLVLKEYYPRVETLLKTVTGASRVIIFDHTTRKRDPALNKEDNPNGKEQPATTVHCDQGPLGAVRRLRMHLPENEDADALLAAHRVQILNVWRPLRGPVVDWPLAQMDYSSLAHENIHPCALWRGSWEDRGQTMTFSHNPAQKWFYLDRHGTDEVTVLKIWDSRGDVAQCCPHAAFRHPETPKGCDPRESLEVRCLLIY